MTAQRRPDPHSRRFWTLKLSLLSPGAPLDGAHKGRSHVQAPGNDQAIQASAGLAVTGARFPNLARPFAIFLSVVTNCAEHTVMNVCLTRGGERVIEQNVKGLSGLPSQAPRGCLTG
jgi:hypothetical protein